MAIQTAPVRRPVPLAMQRPSALVFQRIPSPRQATVQVVHPMDQGDGTFAASHQAASSVTVLISPTTVSFNLSNLGSACSFDHFGQTLTGKSALVQQPGRSLVLRHVRQMMARRIQHERGHHVTTRTATARQLVPLAMQPPSVCVSQRIPSPRPSIVQVVRLQWIRVMAPSIAFHQVQLAVMSSMLWTMVPPT